MTSWAWRAGLALAGTLLGTVVPLACSGPPTDEEVGKLGQRCFPGDFCEEGLTCVAKPVNDQDSGRSLGTDGGQCLIVGASGELEAGEPDADASLE